MTLAAKDLETIGIGTSAKDDLMTTELFFTDAI